MYINIQMHRMKLIECSEKEEAASRQRSPHLQLIKKTFLCNATTHIHKKLVLFLILEKSLYLCPLLPEYYINPWGNYEVFVVL